MSTLADKNPALPTDPASARFEQLPQRLAEAAKYAVLRRIAPGLRHDVAGAMQPVGMLMMVLQRRMQLSDPDLAAITKNLASVAALTKEASTACMNALAWMASCDDMPISLHSALNEAKKLLETDFAAAGLELVNGVSDEHVSVPQNFYRTVLVGALLAFCDQRSAGASVEVKLAADARSSNHSHLLHLRMLAGDTDKTPASSEPIRPPRAIDWRDVEAMAGSVDVTMARGEGWLTLGLPRAR